MKTSFMLLVAVASFMRPVTASFLLTSTDGTLNAGENITLHCRFVGPLLQSEPHHFSWEGPALGSDRIQIVNSPLESVLHIRNLSTADGGTYTCRHTNANAAEHDFQVNVVPRFGEVELHQTFTAGSLAVVECPATMGDPPATMLWGQNLNSLNAPEYYDGRFGFLEIVDISAEDAGNYTCTLQWFGDVDSRTIMVTVEDGVYELQVPQIDPFDDVVLSVDESLSLTCSASGEGVSYQWRALGDAGGTFEAGAELFVPASQLQNGGSFLCTASNVYGSDEDVITVSIRVVPLPAFKRHLPIIIPEGDTAILTYQLDNSPLNPSYSWTHTTPGGETETFTTTWGQLTISNARLSDSGNYTLVVSNEYGSSVQEFQLKVERKVVFMFTLTSVDETCQDIKAQAKYNDAAIETEINNFITSDQLCSCDVSVRVVSTSCHESTLIGTADLIGEESPSVKEMITGRGEWQLFSAGELTLEICSSLEACMTPSTPSRPPTPAPITSSTTTIVVAVVIVVAAAAVALGVTALLLYCCKKKRNPRVAEAGDTAEKGVVRIDPPSLQGSPEPPEHPVTSPPPAVTTPQSLAAPSEQSYAYIPTTIQSKHLAPPVPSTHQRPQQLTLTQQCAPVQGSLAWNPSHQQYPVGPVQATHFQPIQQPVFVRCNSHDDYVHIAQFRQLTGPA